MRKNALLFFFVVSFMAQAIAKPSFSIGFALNQPKKELNFGFGINGQHLVDSSSCTTCISDEFCPNCPECIAQLDSQVKARKRNKDLEELDGLTTRRNKIESRIKRMEKEIESLEYELDRVERRIKIVKSAL